PRFSPMAGRPGDLIKVVDVKRLDPKTALYVVEVGGKHALLAVSEHEVKGLSSLELDDELIREQAAKRDASRPPALSFGQILARSAGKVST
ncbi:MAG TPA: flagellar biosynthetic protein FliO, partial [Planctomycetota bacterium]|nr:flagellar biosynthetic protein FliO [Planctomycetota bacterium]